MEQKRRRRSGKTGEMELVRKRRGIIKTHDSQRRRRVNGRTAEEDTAGEAEKYAADIQWKSDRAEALWNPI